jgi:hypothetical protein
LVTAASVGCASYGSRLRVGDNSAVVFGFSDKRRDMKRDQKRRPRTGERAARRKASLKAKRRRQRARAQS